MMSKSIQLTMWVMKPKPTLKPSPSLMNPRKGVMNLTKKLTIL